MRRVYRDKETAIHILICCQKTKSASRPGYKPVIKRGSTASFVLPSVYIGFPLFVLPDAHPEGHSSIVFGIREFVSSGRTVSSSAFCAACLRPAPPSRRAPLRTDPLGICASLGLDRYVYIGFGLFVLMERRSSDVSSIPWRNKRLVFSGRTIL